MWDRMISEFSLELMDGSRTRLLMCMLGGGWSLCLTGAGVMCCPWGKPHPFIHLLIYPITLSEHQDLGSTNLGVTVYQSGYDIPTWV